MAALVVRSSDHDSALLTGLGHHGSAHFQADKVVSRIARNDDSSSSLHGGRSRSRKNKNGPKKQPQRGLGVAQLEKLRLQEQSKQDAACLASFGLVPLPSGYGFEQGPAEVCLPHPLLSRHHHHHIKGILSLGSGYRSSPTTSDRNGGFASSDPPLVSDPSLAILMQHEMAAAIHGSRMVAGAASKSPLGGSGAPRIVLADRHPVEKNANAAMSAMRVCSTASRTEEMMIKQHQQQQQQQDGGKAHKSGDVSGHHLGVNCVQLFDASLPPGSLPMRDCRELSMVGIPKELSSFQTKFPGNQVWPSMHNASAEKRPCVVISLDHGEILPNTPTAQSETADNILKGAHYTPRSISTALGKSSLPFLKPDTGVVVSPGFETKAKLDHYLSADDNSTSSVSSMPFLRKRAAAACYLDSPAKKSAGGGGADFLALSLSIAQHSSSGDIESSSSRNRICAARCGDDTKATPTPQRSSLSLQEALTDVEDGSSGQRSPSSHGGNSSAEDASTIEVDASVVVLSRHHHHHCHRSSGIQDVDLSLKLAI